MRVHPFLAGLRPTLHIAHRGGAALAPENTMVAFRQAVERWRTDMLELDVHPTRDGELVVFHDAELHRCTDGGGPIRARTAAELAQLDAGYRFTRDGREFPFRNQGIRIPTLREVLRAFPGLRLNVELKQDEPGAVEAFVALIRAEGAADRVCAGSEHDAIAARIASHAPDLCLFYPKQALIDLVQAVHTGNAPPIDERYLVMDMPYRVGGLPLLNAALLRTATRLGRWINVWTIDDPRDLRRLVDLGVGGIMTDRPDLLRAALEGRLC